MKEQELLFSLQLCVDPVACVLICCHPECLISLSPTSKQVSSYLSVKHQVSFEQRSCFVSFLENRKPALQNPLDAPPRPDGSEPDPNRLLLDGFACKFCNFRTISKQSRSRHATERHQRMMVQLEVGSAAMFQLGGAGCGGRESTVVAGCMGGGRRSLGRAREQHALECRTQEGDGD
jgi:hypothetical protein